MHKTGANEQIEALIASLTSEANQLSANAGSLIYSQEQSSGQYLLILSGSVRLIDQDRTFGSLTIGKLNGPQFFGIEQLLSVTATVEVRCATQCEYILIDIHTLSTDQQKQCRTYLTNKINPTESISIYSSISSICSEASKQWKTFHDVLNSTQLLRSKTEVNRANFIIYLDEAKDGFTYGQVITPEICSSFFIEERWPRIIGIQLENGINTQKISQLPAASPAPPDREQKVLQEPLDRIGELSQGDQQDDYREQDGFRLIRAETQQESFASCLSMLANFYQLPTRRDTITRAAEILANCKPREQSNSKQSQQIPWMARMLSILDELGLAVRWINVDPQQPFRIPTPSVWVNQEGHPILLTRSTGNELTIIDPREGRIQLNKGQAERYFTSQPVIISTNVGLHTPKKQFGIHWLFPYIKRYRIQLIEVFSASFLNQIFALATPLLFQQIIDRVISKGAFDALAPLVILMLIFVVLETIFSSLRTFQFVEVSNRIDISIGAAIVSRLLRINARFFDRRPVGELASRLGELENIRRFLTGTALTVVLDALFATLYFAVMFFYSPLLTLIILLTVPLLFGITIGITPITQRLIRARAEASSRTQSLLVEILGGIQTVKLQNAELTARRQWEDRHLQSINKGFKAVLANTSSSNALQLINKISSILVIGVGAWLVLRNELTLGQLIAFRIISNYVTQPMLRLASTWQSFQELSP